MKLISVDTGLPREVTWHGRIVTTGIFKQPVDRRVALRKLNLDSDRQADLSVHGEHTKRSTAIHWCTTNTGEGSCRVARCRWAPLGKTSLLTACWKTQCMLEISSPSVRRKWL